MHWTPEAEAALAKVPPFVRVMARKSVEDHARRNGMADVTLSLVREVQQQMMGHSPAETPSPADGTTGYNVGANRRESMHLTDDRRYLANDTDDPLHEAFDRKLAVHAMARNEQIPPDGLSSSWASAIAGEHEGGRQRAIYVHVPFCRGHCLFCGFYQNACQPERMRRYVDTLLLEIAHTASAPFARRAPFQAVYFGGGTPTALAAEDIRRMVSGIKEHFPLANDCEMTLEGRFCDFGPEKIDAALECGINRFSLGVQTFDTFVRKSIGRLESGETLMETLAYLRDLGRASIIIDLIYGLPGQSMATWEKDIGTYIDLGIDGCDLYQLNIFTGGPLDKAVRKGALPTPAALKEQADYFVRGVDLMREHHQRRLSITHWAQSTRERSLYNALSRGRSECLPFGAGGGGWIGHRRFFLESNLEEYAARVAAGEKPISMGFEGTERDLLYRDIAYQIELGYCDLSSLSERYHMELTAGIGPVLEQWENIGLVQFRGNCLYLTRAGEFWAVNLAQIIIDALQLCPKTTE